MSTRRGHHILGYINVKIQTLAHIIQDGKEIAVKFMIGVSGDCHPEVNASFNPTFRWNSVTKGKIKT